MNSIEQITQLNSISFETLFPGTEINADHDVDVHYTLNMKFSANLIATDLLLLHLIAQFWQTEHFMHGAQRIRNKQSIVSIH